MKNISKGGDRQNNNSILSQIPMEQSIPTQNIDTTKGNKFVSIIATHQARIRCYLSSILGKPIERFMNGAVLRIEINPTDLLCSLVYQGELNEVKPEKKYYVINNNDSSPNYTAIPFPDVRVPSKYNTNGETYVFFVIRHGQGTHNILKGFQKKRAAVFGNKDTRLTDTGFEQAAMTGHMMTKNAEFLSATSLFSSDLVRTIETLVTVLNQDRNQTISNRIAGKEIIVLPCAHELNYDKSGSCDGSSSQAMLGNENKSSCKSINDCISSYQGFQINWNYYNSFYGNGTRMKSGSNRKHCRNTNFLQEAIDIINGTNQILVDNVSGGKRKRYTRKRRKHKKSTKKRVRRKSKTKRVRRKKTKSRKKARKWSRKYKKSINCRKPKGFSQKQYCKYGRKRKTRMSGGVAAGSDMGRLMEAAGPPTNSSRVPHTNNVNLYDNKGKLIGTTSEGINALVALEDAFSGDAGAGITGFSDTITDLFQDGEEEEMTQLLQENGFKDYNDMADLHHLYSQAKEEARSVEEDVRLNEEEADEEPYTEDRINDLINQKYIVRRDGIIYTVV